jgi:hypothetical protein
MNPQRLKLAMRHGALRARIDAQRLALGQHVWPLEAACVVADKGIAGVDWLKQHPLPVGVAVAVLAILKPSRAWRWAKRGVFLWRSWKTVRNTLVSSR